MLPRLYPIVDAGNFSSSQDLLVFARQLISAGATLIQYRNKKGSARQILSDGRNLRLASTKKVRWIMNDRADLCLAAGFDGVHVGQDDLSPEAVRTLIGPRLWLGVSTHNPEQVAEADITSADYIAIGPVFSTASKTNPDPVVGLEGVRR